MAVKSPLPSTTNGDPHEPGVTASAPGTTGDSQTPLQEQPSRRFPALRSRNFRLLWFGLLTSNVGTWMATTAEHWLVTDLEPTRAAFALGLIAISFGIPMLILPPFGGAMADRLPKMYVLWGAQLSYLGLSLILTVVTLMGLTTVWMLMVYAAGTGVVLAFDNPTRQALVVDLVPRSALTSAISLNAAVFTGAALVGPAVAGALIPIMGAGGVFAIRCVLSLAVIYALIKMTGVSNEPAIAPADRAPLLATVAEGFTYVIRTPFVAVLLLLSLLSGLFGRSYGPLLAVFARDVFVVGSFAFGVMVAAPGLGTLIGSIGLAAREDVHRKGRVIFGMTTAFAITLLAFTVIAWYPAGVLFLVLAGFTSTVGAALVASLLQLHAPGSLRGRVMSYYTLTLIGVPSLGALLVGIVADAIGVQIAVGGAAIIAGAVTAMIFAANRPLRTS